MADEMVKSEVDFCAVQLTEIVEVEPNEAGYRQFKPGNDFAAWSVPEGTMVRVGNEKILLDREQTTTLRDWLKDATYDGQ
jgi:hypothetical protein